MRGVHLKRRAAASGKRRFFWVLRWPSRDGCQEPGETIGYYAPSNVRWRPKRSRVPRLTEPQAEAIRQDKQAEFDAGTADPVKPMRWGDFVRAWVEAVAGTIRPSSMIEYRRSLAAFMEACNPKAAANVTYSAVRRFQQHELEREISAATVNKHIRQLKAVFNEAIKQGWLRDNPFVGVAKHKVAEKDWHRYTPAEFGRILDGCLDIWWRGRATMTYTCALRKDEITHLRWDTDLDLAGRLVKVQPRKGTDAVVAWSPKDTDRRTIPLPDEVIPLLTQLRLKAGDCPYAFVKPERHRFMMERCAAGNRPPDVVNNFTRRWHRILEKGKVPQCEFHSLRKTCVTNWLESGVPPHEVQKWAGHSDIKTTIKYYAKVDKEAFERVRRASAEWMAKVVSRKGA